MGPQRRTRSGLAEGRAARRMAQCFARETRTAKFGAILGYNAASSMYFPAGFAFAALIALIAWNTREEARRTEGTATPKKPS